MLSQLSSDAPKFWVGKQSLRKWKSIAKEELDDVMIAESRRLQPLMCDDGDDDDVDVKNGESSKTLKQNGENADHGDAKCQQVEREREKEMTVDDDW